MDLGRVARCRILAPAWIAVCLIPASPLPTPCLSFLIFRPVPSPAPSNAGWRLGPPGALGRGGVTGRSRTVHADSSRSRVSVAGCRDRPGDTLWAPHGGEVTAGP